MVQFKPVTYAVFVEEGVLHAFPRVTQSNDLFLDFVCMSVTSQQAETFCLHEGGVHLKTKPKQLENNMKME